MPFKTFKTVRTLFSLDTTYINPFSFKTILINMNNATILLNSEHVSIMIKHCGTKSVDIKYSTTFEESTLTNDPNTPSAVNLKYSNGLLFKILSRTSNFLNVADSCMVVCWGHCRNGNKYERISEFMRSILVSSSKAMHWNNTRTLQMRVDVSEVKMWSLLPVRYGYTFKISWSKNVTKPGGFQMTLPKSGKVCLCLPRRSKASFLAFGSYMDTSQL